ncbi:hypothetical protein C499_01460 [Halogeometricum borinquense DSM 11551]|uniref:DUF8006 domain-containing protein n=2 Tax=Halogeometricum borinquense TaxID=60847 RepID=E4NNM8_HALBP|nr:hypothetical protein [Halogeometricum borinquense]ADQ66382.1 hypothetical protein Hbor_07850 [Halogeometricum borinquense DSM 11551]ELY31102.1 hypothetical protein C499_01460 [Halogeometricum borinquense DSM 11551]RYJ15216.1 hypothetical protein ELS19_15520 [Halogeometricum borinquense]
MLPLQVIDSFLLNYNIGQALLLAFVLATVGALPLKSTKIIAANTVLFGVIFILTPQALVPTHYLFLGIALLVVGPLLWTTSKN